MIKIQKVVSQTDVETVADLAREIWTDHYVPIVGSEQVEYMLDKFQSVPAIARQITEGYEYFQVNVEGKPAGYIALISEADEFSMMISKIYVRKDVRGTGAGRKMLEFAEKICRERGLSSIWLTVNKNNANSIFWYEHVGFENAGSIVQDIGHGFIMDDYKMVKRLSEN